MRSDMMLAGESIRIDPIHRQQCLEQAARCRRLAFASGDRSASDELLQLAAKYERSAWAAAVLA